MGDVRTVFVERLTDALSAIEGVEWASVELGTSPAPDTLWVDVGYDITRGTALLVAHTIESHRRPGMPTRGAHKVDFKGLAHIAFTVHARPTDATEGGA
jgi:hypothetical protein